MFRKIKETINDPKSIEYTCSYDQEGKLTIIEDCEKCDTSYKCDIYASMLDISREE